MYLSDLVYYHVVALGFILWSGLFLLLELNGVPLILQLCLAPLPKLQKQRN